jgi:hypothetical protein
MVEIKAAAATNMPMSIFVLISTGPAGISLSPIVVLFPCAEISEFKPWTKGINTIVYIANKKIILVMEAINQVKNKQ